MSKVILYIASSFDGMIARTDGGLDWLEGLSNEENTDYGYAELLQSCGTIIMGKNTYNQLLSFGIEWPYPQHKTYVATNDKFFSPQTPETMLLNSDIKSLIERLKLESDKNIWLVGGGKLINYFLMNNLIDKIIICIAPVILGNGIPLFPDKSVESEWMLEDVEKFTSGIVRLMYSKK